MDCDEFALGTSLKNINKGEEKRYRLKTKTQTRDPLEARERELESVCTNDGTRNDKPSLSLTLSAASQRARGSPRSRDSGTRVL